MDLSREARALLDSARMADSAPTSVRGRARQRLVGAVAAGTISTSAVIAKGASMGAWGAATGTGATFAAGTSLTATLVGAVATGLSLGLVALSPTSAAPEQPAVTVIAARAAPATQPMATAATRSRAAAMASNVALPTELQAPEISPQPATSIAVPRAREQPVATDLSRLEAPIDVGAPPNDSVPRDLAPAPNATASLDVSVPPQPSKASIARETELLAQVQRALQQGRPATALAKLNQYAAEFPWGMLHEESIASRVVALCAFGRETDAARWTAEFFRRYPNSPLSARVRGACRAAGQRGLGDRGAAK